MFSSRIPRCSRPRPETRKLVGALARFDAEREVGLQFAFEALGELARGDVLAFLPRERRIVDAEHHVQRRFVHRDAGDRVRRIGRGDGVPDLEVAQPLDGAQIADRDEFSRHAPEVLEAVDLLGPGGSLHAALLADGDGLA
jgi:hypothetical protein